MSHEHGIARKGTNNQLRLPLIGCTEGYKKSAYRYNETNRNVLREIHTFLTFVFICPSCMRYER